MPASAVGPCCRLLTRWPSRRSRGEFGEWNSTAVFANRNLPCHEPEYNNQNTSHGEKELQHPLFHPRRISQAAFEITFRFLSTVPSHRVDETGNTVKPRTANVLQLASTLRAERHGGSPRGCGLLWCRSRRRQAFRQLQRPIVTTIYLIRHILSQKV